MAQPTDSDYNQPSGQSGTNFRTAHNDYFEGVLTQNSGATDPATAFAFMLYADTGATPNELQMRNPGNTAFIKWGEIDADSITLFSDGAAVVGLANTSAFTEPQVIDKAGAAGSLTLRSSLATGIASFLDFAGHDDAANDTVYASIDMNIETATNGSEDGQLLFKVLRNNVDTTRMTIGDTVAVTGTLNATTLRQGGTSIASLIETAKGNLTDDTHSGTTLTIPSGDVTRGERNRFTGSSAITVTINSGTAGDIYPYMNDGTADTTFAAGGGVTIIGGLSLGQQKVCTIEYVTATRVFIYGENV